MCSLLNFHKLNPPSTQIKKQNITKQPRISLCAPSKCNHYPRLWKQRLVFAFRMSGITQYVFCDWSWLLSLDIFIEDSSIFVLLCVSFILLDVQYSNVWIYYNLFVVLLMDICTVIMKRITICFSCTCLLVSICQHFCWVYI